MGVSANESKFSSLKVAYSDNIQVVTKSLILKTLQPHLPSFFFPLYFPFLTGFSLSLTQYLIAASPELSRRRRSNLLYRRSSLSCRRWHRRET